MYRALSCELVLIVTLFGVSPAVASPKPCRDANGHVVCAKPAKPAPKRCKDAAGRFVSCQVHGAKPTDVHH